MSGSMDRVAADDVLEAETYKSILGSRETFHSVHSIHSAHSNHSVHTSSEDIHDDHVDDDDRLALPPTQRMANLSNANSARSLAEGLPKVVITQPSDASLLDRKRARTLSDTSNVGDGDSTESCWCCCSADKESRCCTIL
uniref:Uncharacterized protein n=1 Tax=Plectus sambesii TaxID=2011161 RepID=A0A914V680_9BILA